MFDKLAPAGILVSCAPSPLNDVAVTTPTFKFGAPASPYAVVAAPAVDAVPVKFPTKVVAVTIPVVDKLTVTIPADIGLTFKLLPKSIVAAVPTKEPSSLIMIPVPVPATPIRPEPSPTNVPVNLVAVTIPAVTPSELNVNPVPTLIEPVTFVFPSVVIPRTIALLLTVRFIRFPSATTTLETL